MDNNTTLLNNFYSSGIIVENYHREHVEFSAEEADSNLIALERTKASCVGLNLLYLAVESLALGIGQLVIEVVQ